MTKTKPFSERLHTAMIEKECALVVGLDPRMGLLPEEVVDHSRAQHRDNLRAAADSVLKFNMGVIDAVADIVPAIKPQLAFYEQLGVYGIDAFEQTAKYANSRGLLVIADGKRNDIGSTASGYADAYLGQTGLWEGQAAWTFPVDALTVNPYLGSDGIVPFVDAAKAHGNGLFVLVKTSNPSSSEIQDLVCEGKKIYEIVGGLVSEWGKQLMDSEGYSSVGAVVGATFPEEADRLRKLMPHTIFLVPGFGAQGGSAADVVPCFNEDGLGAIVNSSRDIIFAYRKRGGNFRDAARQAAIDSRDSINTALRKEGKCAW
jgi:orotidine-5'-phosphate decarboxylase